MHRYRSEIRRHRRPFWLPAVNFYVIIAAFASASFMFILLALGDSNDEAGFALFSAGIGAGIVFMLGVVVREIIVRNAQEKYLAARRRIDRNIKAVARLRDGTPIGEGKLTLEQNATILREIERKSAAAKVLNKLPQGHKEVFELCEQYMAAVEEELPRVGPGSPRLAALRKGSKAAGEYHRYHLLQFVEIEAKSFAQEVGTRVNISDKLDTAQKALNVVDLALKHYPHEQSLRDSRRVLNELVSSIKASGLVEQAEQAEASGSYRQAMNFYEDALIELNADDEFPGSEHQAAAEKIEKQIERIKAIVKTD